MDTLVSAEWLNQHLVLAKSERGRVWAASEVQTLCCAWDGEGNWRKCRAFHLMIEDDPWTADRAVDAYIAHCKANGLSRPGRTTENQLRDLRFTAFVDWVLNEDMDYLIEQAAARRGAVTDGADYELRPTSTRSATAGSSSQRKTRTTKRRAN